MESHAKSKAKTLSIEFPPRFRCQECVLDLSGNASRDYDALKSLHQKDSWKNLERVMLENVRGSEVLFLSKSCQGWLPDGYSRIFRSYVFGPSGFWTMAPLRYAAKFDPFLSLDCAPTPSTLAQSKERKGSNFEA